MADSSAPAPQKRSLFKKPAWASKSTSVESSTVFYDQRESTYKSILEEKERKRERKLAKVSDRQGPEGNEHEKKRRRISKDSYTSAESDSSLVEESKDSKSENKTREGPVTRSTPVKKDKLPASPESSPTLNVPSLHQHLATSNQAVIDLEKEGDNHDDGASLPASLPNPPKRSLAKSRPKIMTSDPESEDDDEYTLELKRKAREKARLLKLGIDRSNSQQLEQSPSKTKSPQGSDQSRPGSAHIDNATSLLQSPTRPRTMSNEEDDKVVQILIRSTIPNTKPLIVRRLARQNLQQVKEMWCRRQNFDATMSRKVFLTWRGTQLFNSTTCNSILKQLQTDSSASFGKSINAFRSSDDDDDDDGLGHGKDPSGGKIEVEAVTQEILDERRIARQRAEQGLDVVDDDEDDDNNHDGEENYKSGAAGPTPKEPEYTISLTAPGFETLHIKVRAHTPIAKIMAAFKQVRTVDEAKTCWLMLDGDRLDPDALVQDTGIEGDDSIDVLIR